ncbi:hypothetical protein L0Y69_00020 [bacterium]|nr:hypothetical protein [bacterium]
MITNELLAFIKEELAKGTAEGEIQKALMEGGGWSDMDVKEAFDAVGIYSQTYQGTIRDAIASPSQGTPAVGQSQSQMPVEPNVISQSGQGLRIIEHGPLVPAEVPKEVTTMREKLVLPSTVGQEPQNLSGFHMAANMNISPVTPAPAIAPALAPNFSPAQPPPVGFRKAAYEPAQMPPATNRGSYLAESFGQNANTGALSRQRVEVQGQVREKEKKHGHGFLYFIILLIILTLIIGGGVFAYWKGLLPIGPISMLDSLGQKIGMVSLKGTNDTGGNPSGLAISDPNLIPTPQNPSPTPQPQSQSQPSGPEYYPDRIKITLPSGSPVSVTTIASSVASELRGKVSSCEYSTVENSCVITVPVTAKVTLASIITDLKKDSRLKGVAQVEM